MTLQDPDIEFSYHRYQNSSSVDASTVIGSEGRGRGNSGLTKAEELGLVPNAVPTRSWKPGKVSVACDGIFPKSAKCLSTHAPFESSLEERAHVLLSTDPRIRRYVCQPPPLHYWMPNGEGGQDKREYTPDFIALTEDDRLLAIDAKASVFAKSHKWLSREPHIRAAYRRDHDVELVVWTEKVLKAEPRLTNARTMYRHRFAPDDLTIDFEVIAEVEARGGQASIGELCASLSTRFNVDGSKVFGAIMRGALDGILHLCSASRFGPSTSVQISEVYR